MKTGASPKLAVVSPIPPGYQEEYWHTHIVSLLSGKQEFKFFYVLIWKHFVFPLLCFLLQLNVMIGRVTLFYRVPIRHEVLKIKSLFVFNYNSYCYDTQSDEPKAAPAGRLIWSLNGPGDGDVKQNIHIFTKKNQLLILFLSSLMWGNPKVKYSVFYEVCAGTPAVV